MNLVWDSDFVGKMQMLKMVKNLLAAFSSRRDLQYLEGFLEKTAAVYTFSLYPLKLSEGKKGNSESLRRAVCCQSFLAKHVFSYRFLIAEFAFLPSGYSSCLRLYEKPDLHQRQHKFPHLHCIFWIRGCSETFAKMQPRENWHYMVIIWVLNFRRLSGGLQECLKVTMRLFIFCMRMKGFGAHIRMWATTTSTRENNALWQRQRSLEFLM